MYRINAILLVIKEKNKWITYLTRLIFRRWCGIEMHPNFRRIFFCKLCRVLLLDGFLIVPCSSSRIFLLVFSIVYFSGVCIMWCITAVYTAGAANIDTWFYTFPFPYSFISSIFMYSAHLTQIIRPPGNCLNPFCSMCI